jgi:hypothetical protein
VVVPLVGRVPVARLAAVSGKVARDRAVDCRVELVPGSVQAPAASAIWLAVGQRLDS